jgi:voltage-gated potassium channel
MTAHSADPKHHTAHSFKERMYVVIFESDTKMGLLFDRVLIYAILLSVLVVVLDSVASISKQFHGELVTLEWMFTILFSIEYIARLYCAKYRWRYATSFYGVIDFLAVVPTYLALIFPELHALIDVRVLRLIRMFRIFKLTEYMSEYQHLAEALSASRRKILVFLSVVLMVVTVMGSVMYVVEGPSNGFTSIPIAVYWAITTMTTVGFGDITPHTDLGKLISSAMMLMGWGTLAVPTGIVTAEFSHRRNQLFVAKRSCDACCTNGHETTDQYCRHCGTRFPTPEN